MLQCSELDQRVSHRDWPITGRRKLGEHCQGREPYEEFAGDVMHLVTMAFPGVPLATQEEFAAEAFLRVYRSPSVGYHCINREPKTLAEAQELVDAYEHNYRATVGQAEQTKGRARRICFADEHHNSSDEEDSTARQISTPWGTVPIWHCWSYSTI